jgi:hypothetical protein
VSAGFLVVWLLADDRIYRCTGTGSRGKGCGNMVRMEVTDAAVNEIMATTFRVPVERLILIKGLDPPGRA